MRMKWIYFMCKIYGLNIHPYEKVPRYNHDATMVYHGKQWYTVVNCGIPWYNFSCTMAHPCATMVQRTCTMVHPCTTKVQFTCTMACYGIRWYIFLPPQYKFLTPWYVMVYHGTTFMKVYYRTPKFGIPWYNLPCIYHCVFRFHLPFDEFASC